MKWPLAACRHPAGVITHVVFVKGETNTCRSIDPHVEVATDDTLASLSISEAGP